MVRTISNTDDVVDSRNVIERIEELEADDSRDADDDAELRALKALAEEASGYAPDWQYGETLVRDSYFVEFAKELAEDIGAIDANVNWPHNCIDWEHAAEALQVDYTAVDWDGVTYWIR